MDHSSENSENLLGNSWVELSSEQHGEVASETVSVHSNSDPSVTYISSMVKLLIDAQQESATPSRPNSNEASQHSSPKSPASPNSEWSNEEWRSKQDPGTDWIWDWSSRPEAQQSFDKLSEKFRHPGSRLGSTTFSVRNTPTTKKTQLFSWTNLPTLLLTHACTFFMGAAVVFIYLKKYCNFSGIAQVALD